MYNFFSKILVPVTIKLQLFLNASSFSKTNPLLFILTYSSFAYFYFFFFITLNILIKLKKKYFNVISSSFLKKNSF